MSFCNRAKSSIVRLVLAGLLLGAAVTPSDAQTRSSNLGPVCVVEETSDGFVALRDAPSTAGRILARMTVDGYFRQVLRNGRPVRQGNWIHVVYGAPDKSDAEIEQSGPRGWMNQRLSAGCDH